MRSLVLGVGRCARQFAGAARPTGALWLLLSGAVTACGGGGDASNDRPAALAARASDAVELPPAQAPPLDAAEQARVDSVLAAIAACPRDGRWHVCSIERRLQLAGLRPARDDRTPDAEATIPGVDAPTTTWQLGRQSIRVALFADSVAARAAFSALDSARAAPPGDTAVAWPARPTLFRSANALALYLGGTDRQVIRVTDALLAGPPQPK